MFWIAVMFALAGAQVVPNFNEKLSQCLKTCKMNCGLTLCGDGDHKCTVTKKHADLCVEMSVGEIGSNPPWAGPDLPKSTFKFRWCQAKYRMWRAPVTDNGLPEGKFVYPRMGKEHGAYLGEDHLHWLTPGCSWAADDNNCTKTLIMDEENYAHLQSDWLALEGHTCARLSTSKCQEDCTEFCELGCNCAWSEDAANSFTRDGVVMRWQRAADSPEWSCHKSFVFDKTCWCENGTGGVKDSCLVQNVHFCQACDAGFHLARDDESSRCVANECICSNGHGAVGPPDCAEDGNHVCVTCDDDEGFFLPELFGVCKVKKCLCNNGSGAVGKACPKHGNYTCTPPCYEGYHHIAEHKTCARNICKCDNGERSEERRCPEHESEHCDSCESYFTMVANKRCRANICTCTNGEGAVGPPGCAEDGNHACVSCEEDEGVFLPEPFAMCQVKECLCDNGVGAVGKACPKHGNYTCTPPCYEGYHHIAERKTCERNICKCDNGEHSEESNCPEHESEHCDSCGSYFTMAANMTCRANVCTCTNGKGAVGPPGCAADGNHACVSCDDVEGVFLPEPFGVCKVKKCLCNNGSGAVGKACPKHGNHTCTPPCYEGYHHIAERKTCATNVCTCTNGAGAVGSPGCAEDGNHACVSCDEDQGFLLPEPFGVCKVKECLCDNGPGAVGKACPKHGNQTCAAPCYEGYHHIAERETCERNICKCDNGEHSEERRCPEHESEHCDSCGSYFTMAANKTCRANVCTCTNGKGAVGPPGCAEDGNHACVSCDDVEGFLLPEFFGVCKVKECSCYNGPGAVGKACPNHGNHTCMPPCYEGYHHIAEHKTCEITCESSFYVCGGHSLVRDEDKNAALCSSGDGGVCTDGLCCTPRYTVTSFTGGSLGFADGYRSEAQFNFPNGIAVASDGSVYIADSYNSRIRLIAPNGTVSTLAGTGEAGFRDGDAHNAQFYRPTGVDIGEGSNVYVTDYWNHRIRRIDTTTRHVTTVAGNGVRGFLDGYASDALFNNPIDLAVDVKAGKIYVVDRNNHRIRCISHSQVVTLAGTGGKSFCDGNAEEAMFDSPEGIVLSPTDDIYIADAQNNRIRRIDMKSTPYLVSTVAGTGKRGSRDGPAKQATFKYPIGVALDAEGFLYVSDSEDNRIRRVSPKGIVITLAGTGVRGFLDGDAVDAQFRYLRGLAVSPNGELYAAGESRIRRIQVGR